MPPGESKHHTQTISPRLLGLLITEAQTRALLGSDRAAIVSRLESFAADILPNGGGVFSAAFSSHGGEGGSLRSIGDAFWNERLAGKDERRREGSFYTPDTVIDQILGLIWNDLFPDGLTRPGNKMICDPALGCGFFFLRLIEKLREKKLSLPKIRRWAAKSLHGVDTDAQAVFTAKSLLWIALSEGKHEFLPDAAHFAVGDSLLGPAFGQTDDGTAENAVLNWTTAFPDAAEQGGFDVVAGNPPYEVLTNFARRPEQKKLAEALRQCGFYRDALAGQINLYRCFVERGLDVLKPGGALSYVTPLSLARDGAAAPLRTRLLERENAAQWFLYGEKERLFSGVTQSACVFRAVRGKGAAKSVSISVGGRAGKIPLAELRECETELALPGLTAKGLKLWRWFRRNCPGRLRDVAEARVGEVDQTFHRACMTDTNTGTLLARGAHLSAFRLDTEARQEKERFLDLPRFLEMKGKGAAADQIRARATEWRVAQLGIRNMQSRPRLLAALLPPGVYAGNSLNVYRVFPGVDRHFVAGVLNSVWLDWLFRIISGNNNINLREMTSLPFPSHASAAQSAKVAELYRECARIAEEDGENRIDDLEKSRAALDAAVGECYGVPEGVCSGDLEMMLL